MNSGKPEDSECCLPVGAIFMGSSFDIGRIPDSLVNALKVCNPARGVWVIKERSGALPFQTKQPRSSSHCQTRILPTMNQQPPSNSNEVQLQGATESPPSDFDASGHNHSTTAPIPLPDAEESSTDPHCRPHSGLQGSSTHVVTVRAEGNGTPIGHPLG